MGKIMKISLILPSFVRAELLELCLWSLTLQKINYNLEIVVCNDGLIDDTESVCNNYRKYFEIKYVFSGHRNTVNNLIYINPCFATNIAVKQSTGYIIILSTPELLHLNDSINKLIDPLLINKKLITIPNILYFDNTGNTLKYIKKNREITLPDYLMTEIQEDKECKRAVEMTFFMGMYKNKFVDIGGFDEDFVGFAAQDNDLMERLLLNGLKYYRTNSKIIHLYHGKRHDSNCHWENPKWAFNYKLFQKRKGIIVRNKDRKWGEL